jgi:glutathione peroxidase-family protein
MEAKTAGQIAEECDIDYHTIYRIIKKKEIKGTKRRGDCQIFFNEHQQELIHNILTASGKMEWLTLKSKINN